MLNAMLHRRCSVLSLPAPARVRSARPFSMAPVFLLPGVCLCGMASSFLPRHAFFLTRKCVAGSNSYIGPNIPSETKVKTLLSNKLSIAAVLSAVMILSLASVTKAAAADSIPPAMPRGFSATVSTSLITPAWINISGKFDVTRYKIFRAGTSAFSGYSGTGRAASTRDTHAVSAYDAADNTSIQSGSGITATSPEKTIGTPTIGAHALAFYSCSGHVAWLWRTLKSGGISTPSMITQASGSTLLTWVGRGNVHAFTSSTFPMDNKANTSSMIGSVHDFSPLWPNSGEALYASRSAAGGSGHIVTAPMPKPDEITLAAVEVKNGGVIQDAQWNSVTAPPLTSLSVTTTGPATLVAIWVGDFSAASVTASPNNGFTVINSQVLAECSVEAFVATKDVSTAGTFNVTWTATPAQGAHLWLVAVQNHS